MLIKISTWTIYIRIVIIISFCSNIYVIFLRLLYLFIAIHSTAEILCFNLLEDASLTVAFRTLSMIQDGAFCKNDYSLSDVNYFCKTLHLRYLTVFWIRFCFWWRNVQIHVRSYPINLSFCRFWLARWTIKGE